ncbi:NAD(P)H-dependent oxidoreductase [Alteraurantiacibacter aestuarii]|uniref:NAD(P)H-dependent oxidoreductase n=1 Tax=Alteraurantiacibacter aestuarii TaxID=650004 RepID=UPI0031D6E58D
MSRILILNGHPHDDPDHFVHALAAAYAAGADDLHETRRIDIARLDFPILRDPGDWKSGDLPESLRDARDALEWADHLVIIYPLWLGDMPALLKGFLEQIARPGIAIEPKESGMYRQLLKGKSARLIVTMGMPAIAYMQFFRGHSVKSFKRNILQFVGIKPVRVSIIGMVDHSDRHRRKWLRKVERLGRWGR